MADRLEQLDTRIEIVTPENIAFQYQLAGPFRRLPAYLIDVLVKIAIIVIVWIGLVFADQAGLQGIGVFLGLVVYFALDWFYGGVFEALWNGQTPGKRALGIRVVGVDGQPVQAWQAVLRNLLRVVDALPIWYILPTYVLGLSTVAATRRMQRLGDLASGTMVVVEEQMRAYGVVQVRDAGVIELAAKVPPNFRASRSLARALSRYVERRLTFSLQRRNEIAWHLAEPLREKLDLPRQTGPDLLLCALYHKTFIADFGLDEESTLKPAKVVETALIVDGPVDPTEIVIRT